MPIPSETHPKPSPTIQARSSAELRKPSVQFWLTFTIAFSGMLLLLMPWYLAVQMILTGLLFSSVTWAARKVR